MPEAKVARLKDKIAKLKEEIVRLNAINVEMMKAEDKQISLTDPDARSMATSGRDTGIVGYNVQAAVDTEHHLIVAHEVTNVGTDRHLLANMAEQARDEMGVEKLEAVADRGYYEGNEIRACEEAGITVTLPKPMTSGAKAAGRFGKQDFVYLPDEDVYRCPAGERDFPLCGRGGGQADPPLLDERLSDMCAQSKMHDRPERRALAVGTRGCPRCRTGTNRSQPRQNDRAPADCPRNTRLAPSRPGWARRTSSR